MRVDTPLRPPYLLAGGVAMNTAISVPLRVLVPLLALCVSATPSLTLRVA
jgi:hypothetical protein